MLSRVTVGEPYPDSHPPLPTRAVYRYRHGRHESLLVLDRPRPWEVEDVRRGASEFAVATVEGVVFFLCRFGVTLPWSAAPYSWHLEREHHPDIVALPPLDVPEEASDPVQIALVESETALVRALRLVRFSPLLTRALHESIVTQAQSPWEGEEAYHAARHRVQERYRPEDLLYLALARDRGEDQPSEEPQPDADQGA